MANVTSGSSYLARFASSIIHPLKSGTERLRSLRTPLRKLGALSASGSGVCAVVSGQKKKLSEYSDIDHFK